MFFLGSIHPRNLYYLEYVYVYIYMCVYMCILYILCLYIIYYVCMYYIVCGSYACNVKNESTLFCLISVVGNLLWVGI
jgi:hypothetical protein